MSTERLHHPRSPSSLPYLHQCPKFKNRSTQNLAAEIGTLQHAAVESGQDDHRLDDAKALAVIDCMQYCESRIAKYPGCTVLKEQYLPIDDEIISVFVPARLAAVTNVDPGTDLESLGFRQLESCWVDFKGSTGGYADFCLVSADETVGEVIDFKFGAWPVDDAEDNEQGFSYLLGLLKKFPKLKKIAVRFLMPHLDYISEHVFSREDFAQLRFRVMHTVETAKQAQAKDDDFTLARPNTKACSFCSLIGRCPKVTQLAIETGARYAPLEIPENLTPSAINCPSDVSKGLKLVQTLSTWCEAFKRQANAKTIDDANFIPDDYVLVQQRKRKVIRPIDLLDLAQKFLPAEKRAAVMDVISVPLGEVEELISLAAPRGQKEKRVEEFGEQALTLGAVEYGAPFAYLRQRKKTDKSEKFADK